MGVRFDALHFARKALGDPWPVMNIAIRVNERDVGVRVDDACHAQVLVDALSPSLIFGFHSARHFQTVFLERTVFEFPKFPSFV